MKTVAVIGAGLTGISAVRCLLASGHFRVSLFESNRLVGGRMRSLSDEEGRFDHGAQYFTARSDEFSAFVRHFPDEFVKLTDDFRIRSLDHAVSQESSEQPTSVVEVNSLHTATVRHVGKPSIGAALGSVVAKLKSGYPEHLALHLGTTVEKIDRIVGACGGGVARYLLHVSQDGEEEEAVEAVVVIPDEEEQLTFDYVVMTGFVGNTQLLLRDLDLPFWDQVAERSTQPCVALLLQFDSADQKRHEFPFDAAFVNFVDSVRWICHDSKKPGKEDIRETSEHWLVHFSPDYSESLVGGGKSVDLNIDAEALFFLVQESVLLPLGLAFDEERLVRKRTFVWDECKIDRSLHAEETFLVDGKGIVLAADWVNSSSVQGGFLSGLNAAKHLVSVVESSNS